MDFPRCEIVRCHISENILHSLVWRDVFTRFADYDGEFDFRVTFCGGVSREDDREDRGVQAGIWFHENLWVGREGEVHLSCVVCVVQAYAADCSDFLGSEWCEDLFSN